MEKFQTEKNLIKFLNSGGVAKRLKFYANLLLVKKVKIKFAFKYNEGSFTNGTLVQIGIPKYLVKNSKEQVMACLRALVAHEVEHINSTSWEAMGEFFKNFSEYFEKKYSVNPLVCNKTSGYLNNAIEDGRIERIASSRKEAIKRNIYYMRNLWWIENKTEEKDSKTESEELSDVLFAVCSIATTGRFPNKFLEAYEDNEDVINMVKSWKKQIYKCVEEDTSMGYYERLWELIYLMEDWLADKMLNISVADSEDTLDKLMEGLGELSEELHGGKKSVPMDKAPSKPKEAKEGDGDGEEKNGKELESKSYAGADDTGDDGSMLDEVKRALKEAEVTIKEEEHNTVLQAEIDDLKEEAEELDGSISPEETEEIIRDYEEKKWYFDLKIHKNNYTLLQTEPKTKMQSKKIKKEFLEMFKNKSKKNQKNKRRGVLNTNSLYKIVNNDTKLFENKESPSEVDYAFYILVDGSGSMSGDKYVNALEATAMLEECLIGIAPLKIVQFDNMNGDVNHYIIKNFSDNKKGNYSTTYLHHNYANGCNMDGASIRIATIELAKRREKKKVLIVLSDGLPSGHGQYNYDKAENDVKQSIKEARGKNIEVFNIMFGSKGFREANIESFKYMYEKGIVSCSSENIGVSLCKIVKKELRR